MGWKTLGSKILLKHPRVTVVEDEVELANGHTTRYLRFANMSAAAMTIAINNDGKILLQKEYSYPPNDVMFQLPGGALEPNEDPKDGAARELAEEAGLAGTLSYLGWFYVNNRRSDQKMHIFVARELTTVPTNHDPEESFEEFWLSEEEIDKLIATNQIYNYTALAGWALYKAKSGQ